jgi:CBS domain-containing protein
VSSPAQSQEALRDEHHKLGQLSDRLHAAKDLPALLSAAEDLHDALASHFAHEEHPGGLYDCLNFCVPQHREDLAQLVQDHRDLTAALWQLCQQARQPNPSFWDLREAAEQFIKDLQHHEEREHKIADEALPKGAAHHTRILQLCDEEPAVVRPDSTVADAIQVMVAHRVGAAAVVDGKSVVGIFTERDVLTKVALKALDPGRIPVREFMSTPVETITPETSSGDAFATMIAHHFRHLPVVDRTGKLLRILSIRNLLEAQVEELRQQLDSLEQYVTNDSLGG